MITVLMATDADWIAEEVKAAVLDDDVKVARVHAGVDVLEAVHDLDPDLIVLDLQIGNMGGMATCLELRNEEGGDRIDLGPILMLLDRPADTFLAQRSRADGWLIKPLDAVRLRRAVATLLNGDSYNEGDGEGVEPAAG